MVTVVQSLAQSLSTFMDSKSKTDEVQPNNSIGIGIMVTENSSNDVDYHYDDSEDDFDMQQVIADSLRSINEAAMCLSASGTSGRQSPGSYSISSSDSVISISSGSHTSTRYEVKHEPEVTRTGVWSPVSLLCPSPPELLSALDDDSNDGSDSLCALEDPPILELCPSFLLQRSLPANGNNGRKLHRHFLDALDAPTLQKRKRSEVPDPSASCRVENGGDDCVGISCKSVSVGQTLLLDSIDVDDDSMQKVTADSLKFSIVREEEDGGSDTLPDLESILPDRKPDCSLRIFSPEHKMPEDSNISWKNERHFLDVFKCKTPTLRNHTCEGQELSASKTSQENAGGDRCAFYIDQTLTSDLDDNDNNDDDCCQQVTALTLQSFSAKECQSPSDISGRQSPGSYSNDSNYSFISISSRQSPGSYSNDSNYSFISISSSSDTETCVVKQEPDHMRAGQSFPISRNSSNPPLLLPASDDSDDGSDTLPDLESSPPHLDLGPLRRISPVDNNNGRRIDRHSLDGQSKPIPLKQKSRHEQNRTFRRVESVCNGDTFRDNCDSSDAQTRTSKSEEEAQSLTLAASYNQPSTSVYPYCQQSTSLEPASSYIYRTELSLSSSSVMNLSSTEKLLLRYKSRVRFLTGLAIFPAASVSGQTKEFEDIQTSFLIDLLDDFYTNMEDFKYCMDRLETFSSTQRPPTKVLDKVVRSAFFLPVEEERIPVLCQSILMRLWHQYPESVNLDRSLLLDAGDVLLKFLQNSSPESVASASASTSTTGSMMRKTSFHQARRYFQVFLEGLQLSLSRCMLADQWSVNRSLVFSVLSTDVAGYIYQKITRWIEFCLIVRQPHTMEVAKEWLTDLQKLLSASILISRDRQEAANRVAEELKLTYRFLADLPTKKLLLQSLECPLLTFCLVRLVMEDQCDRIIFSSQFPSTVAELAHNYFSVLPPHDHMTTPPPSPSDDDLGGRPGPPYSPQACEELSVLIYYITKSYLACKQRHLNGDLRTQVLKEPIIPLMSEDQRKELTICVQELDAHLHSLSAELTPTTLLYLSLLKCLCHNA